MLQQAGLARQRFNIICSKHLQNIFIQLSAQFFFLLSAMHPCQNYLIPSATPTTLHAHSDTETHTSPPKVREILLLSYYCTSLDLFIKEGS